MRDKKINQEIGLNIKKYREKRNLNLNKLSKLAGYSSHSSLALIEQGKQGITFEKLSKVAEVLNVSIELLQGKKELVEEEERFDGIIEQLEKSKKIIAISIEIIVKEFQNIENLLSELKK